MREIHSVVNFYSREQVEMIEAKMNSTHSHSGMNHRHESNSSSEVVSTSNNGEEIFNNYKSTFDKTSTFFYIDHLL